MSSRINDVSAVFKVDPLTKKNIPKDPLQLFNTWFEDVLKAGIPEPNAMTLATADEDGHPAARMVLMKGCDEHGFVFYTNYLSRKGQQLAVNPFAALLFWWPAFSRQVRIEGYVEKVSREQSDIYFKSRPRGHQIGALVSRQSKALPDYAHLEKKFNDLENSLAGKEIPRPESWGGYRLKPHVMEFWQSRPNRLHDRFRYSQQKSGKWFIERLAP